MCWELSALTATATTQGYSELHIPPPRIYKFNLLTLALTILNWGFGVFRCFYLKQKMVTEGVEPSTVALLAQRSNQLSYATSLHNILQCKINLE